MHDLHTFPKILIKYKSQGAKVARESYIPIGVLNIAMEEPHSPARYVQLFRKLYSMRKIVDARGVNGALIGNLHNLRREDPEAGLTGEFYQFIQLDINEPWFDLESRDAASPDDIQSIVIPEKLKPHLARFSFIFFPKGHRLYIQLKSKNRTFGIRTAASVIKALLTDKRVNDFGTIEVTIEPDQESVAAIFKIPHIHQLRIELLRPNPDDHQEAERKLLDRLQKQGAKKMLVALSSGPASTIQPDEETKFLAKVAASNGYVFASGRDYADHPVERSTRETPWIENAVYDADLKTANDVLFDTAREMHARVA